MRTPGLRFPDGYHIKLHKREWEYWWRILMCVLVLNANVWKYVRKRSWKILTLCMKWTQVYYSEKQKVMVDEFYIYHVIWVSILLINLEEKKNEFFYQVKLRTFKLN